MKEKDQYRTRQGSLPEAIHPEIGNGAAWEADPHFLNLRKVDPSAALDHKLIDDVQRDEIIRQWNSDVFPPTADEISTESPEERLPELTEEVTREKVRKERKILASARDKGQKPDWFESIEDELVLKEDPNKPSEPAVIHEVSKEEHRETQEEESHPVPEGKRMLKAVKKAQKKHKSGKRESGIPDQAQADGSGLSPYTKWLKSLRGSEYVHPYEDDYALAGLSGPHKQGISETFADLLASQGYKEQAADMYRLLMTKYPEKSSFFAAKIEALK